MKNKLFYWCAVTALVFLCLPMTALAADNPVGVAYRGHIQDLGDYPADGSWVDSPEIIGTEGQCKRIEGFEIKLTGTVPEGMELRYNVHVQNKGWLYDENDSSDWPKEGAYAGTRGESLRIEAVKIVLTDSAGKALTGYSVQYRGHVQNVGDLPADKTQWLADGKQLGTVGSSLRLEALLVQVVKNKADLSVYNDLLVQIEKLKEGDYTSQTWAALQISLKDHQVTDENSQTEVDTAEKAIKLAYDGLEKVDLSVYNTLLAQIEKLKEGDYTSQTWAALQTALKDHQVNMGNSQVEVNAAVKAIQAAYDGLAKKIQPQVYDKAGTYGPKQGSETIAGDVIIAADGVILQNLVIAGNLTISEAVGDGNVTLNNVAVKGDTFVRGGGIHSITINGGEYSRIIMEKTASGAVRIMAKDVDGLDVVISEDASGETIILEGAFDSVTVNAPNMTVTTQGNTTTIGKMTVSEGAAGSTVTVAAGTTVADLVLDGKAAVKGQGNVAKAEVKADGVVFEKKPGAYTVEPGVVIPPVFPTPDSGGGSGGGYTPPGPIAVTGVSLNKTDLILSFDATETLAAAVAPADAANKAVTWKSSDDSIAEVDAAGKVTGNGNTEGTAIITATSADGTKSASCIVTVTRFKVTKTDEGIGRIDGRNGSSTDIEIPETIGGLTITEIGGEAFQSTPIEKVTIPKSVKTIGDSAFRGCTALSKVTFATGSNLETIGGNAFQATAISAVAIPQSVKTIGVNAFIGCYSLRSVAFAADSNLETIGVGAFADNGVVVITLPKKVTAIPDQAFFGCPNLSSVTLPSGLTAIGADAFKNCSKLTAITIPKGVISIGKDAFGFEAGKEPANRSYTFRGNVPGTMGAGAASINPGAVIPATPTPTIRYYENYDGFTATAWAGYTKKEAILAKPVLNTPSAANTGTPAVELSWGIVANATGYDIYVCEESGSFTGTPITVAGGALSTSISDNLISGKTYKFVVKARDEYGESVLSVVESVRIPYPVPVTKLTISASPTTLVMGKTAQLSAAFTPANATQQKVSWSSSDTSIATVDAATGVITANNTTTGSVNMTGTSEDGGKTGTCQVTVVADQVTGVSLDKGDLTVGVTKTAQLTAAVAPENVTVSNVTWESSNESIATVDNTGKVTGVKEGGPVEITATAENGAGRRRSQPCRVTVKDLKPAITGVSVPYNGGTPDTDIDATSQYTGSITWKDLGGTAPGGSFCGSKVYAATITLTLSAPYTHDDIPQDFFTLAGATTVVNSEKSLEITAVFPATGAMAINDSGVITAYTGPGGTVVIPETIGGKTVTAIGAGAFSDKNNVTAVTIPQTVKSIGDNAFNSCAALTAIAIPADVTSLGAAAFYCCSALKSVNIPSNLTAIGSDTFNGCSALEAIIIPESVTSIGDSAFYDCQKLTTIAIPEKVTALGLNAIKNCSGLTSVTFTGNPALKTIGPGAFYGCTKLTTIEIPKPVTALEIRAFGGCAALTTITFRGPTPSLDTTAIAAGTTIRHYANYNGYDGWSGMNYVHILAPPTQTAPLIVNSGTGSAAVTVNWNTVAGATAYDVFLSNTIGIYGVATKTVTGGGTTSTSITGLDSSKTYYFTVKAKDAYGESLPSNQILTNLNIAVTGVTVSPTTVPLLIAGASTTLTATVAPANAANKAVTWKSDNEAVATVGKDDGKVTAVAAGTAIITATSAADETKLNICLVTVKPVIETTATTTAVTITKYNGNETAVVIPATIDSVPVTAIGANAFYDKDTVQSVTIPETVTSIGATAFRDCDALNTVTFVGTPKLETIGVEAFRSCDKLANITLPSNLTTIGDSAFYNCNALTAVSFAADSGLTSIGQDAFSQCPITTLTLPDKLLTIGNNAFYCNQLTGTLIIPATVTSIGDMAFERKDLSGIPMTTLEIKASPLTIGKDAFKNHNLTSIKIPAGVIISTGPDTMGINGSDFQTVYNKTAGIYQFTTTWIRNS